jgi:putative ABC transport system permease protein
VAFVLFVTAEGAVTREHRREQPNRSPRACVQPLMETLVRDLRYAARVLGREPGFTLLAVLALALGIGATTAMFTVVDSVLLRPLPYARPERLVVALHGPAATAPVSPADFFDYRRAAQSFAGLAAAQAWGATLDGGDRPERLAGLQVSTDLFDVLGVAPQLGRSFVPGEDQRGRHQMVVLSHRLWQRQFGGDRSIVGRSILLDATAFLVIGVMPERFQFAPFWQTRAELWVPLVLAPRRDDRGGRSLRLFGRLKDDVSVARAQAEMATIAARLARDYPATNTNVTITVRPLLDKVVSGVRGTLVALMAMVTFVLLIACANVASALLARASGRQRETAMRVAIGATRARVVRQILTESVLLALVGAVVGLILTVAAIDWLLAILPAGSLPRQGDVTLDVRVFAAAAAAALVTGVFTGLLPAISILRASATAAFHDGARGTTEGARRKHVRGLLVATEVALALALLIGAAVMGRTLQKLTTLDPGFALDRVAVATVTLSGTPHAAAAARAPMFERIRARLAAMPGVSSVSAINHLPLAGDRWQLGYSIDGRPTPDAGRGLSAVYRVVQPGYFSTIGIRMLEGRDFTDADGASSPHVAIVNSAMAKRHWPGESPIGRHIHLPGPSDVSDPITIVGVAADARQSEWTESPDDEVYVAYAQRAGEFGLASMTFVLRTSVDPAGVAAGVAREVATVDRAVPVSDPTTMSDVAATELWRERMTAQLTGIFAIAALGLAAIGVHAVVTYSVARRTREFGVRVALGASRRSVLNLALTEALGPVCAGAVGGLVLAVAASRMLQALLFDVSALDPVSVSGAVFVLVAAAAFAAWLPARRASGVDPVVALRQD